MKNFLNTQINAIIEELAAWAINNLKTRVRLNQFLAVSKNINFWTLSKDSEVC